MLTSLQSVGKVAEGSWGQHPEAPRGTQRQVGCRDIFYWVLFLYSPANLTPRLERVIFFRRSRITASGKEGRGRVTSNQNIPSTLGVSEETFEPYTDILHSQKGLLCLGA